MESNLRIVFFGTPGFAVATLKHLFEHDIEIAAVVTAPDKPSGRGLKLQSSEVKKFALAHDLPLLQPVSLKDQGFIDTLHSFRAQVFVVVAFRMLPHSVWSLPPLGTFNVHASLLPAYRGAAPIHWAIIRGERKTGVTTFLLDDQIDTGKILLQKECLIGPDETMGEIHDKLQILGAELALNTLKGLKTNTLSPVVQKNILASHAPKLHRENTYLDPSDSVERWYNLYRGLTPFPGVLLHLSIEPSVDIKIGKCLINKNVKSNISKIIKKQDELFYSGPDGALQLLEIQWPGKKMMPVADFLRGHSENIFNESA